MSGADKFWCWIICTAIVSVSGCTAVGVYSRDQYLTKASPQSRCVDAALFHTDRLECLKAKQ